MSAPTVVSLCSGAGGLDLGLEHVGYRTVAQAEIDPDARRVLVERFPGVPNFGDLREIEWERVVAEYGRPDVVAAGFPCQPLSLAGKGLVEFDPRWLWPEVARCLRVVRPGLVLLENVPGIFRRPPNGGPRPVGVVLGDLAALGYDALWTGLRSADLGAPHGRDRWFCVAVLAPEPERSGIDADGGVRRRGAGEPARPAQAPLLEGQEVALAADTLADRARAAPDTGSERLDGGGGRDARRATLGGEDRGAVAPRPAEAPADAGHGREPDGARPAGREVGKREAERPEPGQDGRAAADADVEGREGSEPERARGRRGPAVGGQAAPDAGRERRRGGRQPEPRGVEGTRGGLADGRGEVRELEDAEEAPADADSGRRGGREDVEGRGPAGRGGPSGDGGAAPADADGERREPGSGRRVEGGDHARARAEEPDGDGLVGPAEPGTVEWGAYGPAVERWEGVLGRAAPRPTDDLGRLNPRFAEWMLGYPYGWVEVDGVSRTAQLRLIGNSVQVQCGEVVGVWLAEVAGMLP